MVTLTSVFVDVELSNSYFGFLRFSENLDPFDTPLSDLTNETEFKNSLQMVDKIQLYFQIVNQMLYEL